MFVIGVFFIAEGVVWVIWEKEKLTAKSTITDEQHLDSFNNREEKDDQGLFNSFMRGG